MAVSKQFDTDNKMIKKKKNWNKRIRVTKVYFIWIQLNLHSEIIH